MADNDSTKNELDLLRKNQQRTMEMLERILRNSTTPSGPSMSSIERVFSFLGSTGGLNAAAQAAKHGAAFQARQKTQTPVDALKVSGEIMREFAEVYAADFIRGNVQAISGTRMANPGRIEGTDIAKMLGYSGMKAKAVGVTMEALTDPLTAGRGPAAAGLRLAGRGFMGGLRLARKSPTIANAFDRTGRYWNKFYDIDKMRGAPIIRDVFQRSLDLSGNVNIGKLSREFEGFGTAMTPEIAQLRTVLKNTQSEINSLSSRRGTMLGRGFDPKGSQILDIEQQIAQARDLYAATQQHLIQRAARAPVPAGQATTGLPSLSGLSFDKPIADLLKKEWQGTFMNYSRNTPREKVLGGMKDMTTGAKKAMTVIDPIFHARNAFDGIYKNWLEDVKLIDYVRGFYVKFADNPKVKKLIDKLPEEVRDNLSPFGSPKEVRKELSQYGAIGQSGAFDIQDKRSWFRKALETVNDLVRAPLAMRDLRRGSSPQWASKTVNDVHQDYRVGMQPAVIQALSNRFIPFAKYEFQNPWMWTTRLPRYSGKQSLAEKYQRNNQDEKDPWKIPPNERGRLNAFGRVGWNTSFEDFMGTFDKPKGALDRLADAINPLVKLIGEKTLGWSQYRGRYLNERESGEKYKNMPNWFLTLMDAERRNGRLTVNGRSDQMLSVFSRGFGEVARTGDVFAGDKSIMQAVTGLRLPGVQEPWQVAREKARAGSVGSLWSAMPWTANAEAAVAAPGGGGKGGGGGWNRIGAAMMPDWSWLNGARPELPRSTLQIAPGGNTRMVMTGITDDMVRSWAKGSNDLTMKGLSIEALRERYRTDRFDLSPTMSPDEKTRQMRVQDFMRFRGDVDKAVALTAPIGSQTAATNEAMISNLRNMDYYKQMPAYLQEIYERAIRTKGGPISIPFERKLVATQGNQDEGTVIRRLLLSDKSLASWKGEKRTQGMLNSPEKIIADIEREMMGQIMAAQAEGRNFNTPAGKVEIANLQKAASGAKDRLIQRWIEDMTRSMDDINDLIADSLTDPIAAMQMKGENAVQKWLHSEKAIEALNSGEQALIDGVNQKAEAIRAKNAREVEKKRIEIMQKESAQVETFYKERAAAASSILKEAFESGSVGIGAYFGKQRETIGKDASQSIQDQMAILRGVIPEIVEPKPPAVSSRDQDEAEQLRQMQAEDADLQKELENARAANVAKKQLFDTVVEVAETGDLAKLDQYRQALKDAGVDTEAFFEIAARIAKTITDRTKAIADSITAEKDAKAKYDTAIASLQADTAATGLRAKQATPEGATLEERRKAYTDQFDAESRQKRINLERSLNYTEMTPGDIDEANPDDLARYYQTKAELEANDKARTQERTTYLAKIDRDYWAEKVKNAQVGTDALANLTTSLFELSGKKSREMFYLMKAASIASALVKGYEATINAYNAGLSIGGPYALVTGSTFAGIAMAATAAQIANIMAQQMPEAKAKGGLITGGSGVKDDRLIAAMGGEYVVKKKAVQRVGVDFLNAINNESSGFAVPALPSRSRGSYAEGGLVDSAAGFGGETKIVLENNTGVKMKMTDGGMKFDGKQYVRSIIFDLMDSDPAFNGMISGGRQ